MVLALVAPAAVRATVASKPGSSVFAQYVSTTINSSNGLPQNSVRAIAQSADGYVWLGTEEGLVRYDGTHTRIFDRSTDPILHDNDIRSISTAPDGSVWTSTRSGVDHFSGSTIVSHLSGSGHTLRFVFCDAAGVVWIGTKNGLYTVSKDGKAFVRFGGISANASIRQMSEDQEGSLWVATSDGLWSIHQGQSRHHGEAEGLPESDIRTMTMAEDRSLWLVTPTNLVHWRNSVLKRLPVDRLISHCRITSLLVDHGNKLWIGMEQNGLVLLDGNNISRYNASDGLPGDSVMEIQKDRDHNIWVGMNGAGAVRFHAGLFTTHGAREGLSDSQIYLALAAHDGSVWTATLHQALNHLLPSGHVEVLGAKEGLPPSLMYSMFEDRDGSLWVGSNMGELIHVQGRHITVFHNATHAQDQLVAIARGPDDDLFLLYHTQFGLVRFHRGQFRTEPHNIPGLPNSVAMAADGSLWIGSNKGGVTHWNNDVLAMYGPGQGLTTELIETIAVDKDGTVWVGSSPDGLMRLSNGQVTKFTHENGLFDDSVGTITDDLHGWLWITSNKGIYKVRKQELADVAEGRATRIQSIAYGIPDGMRTSECNFDMSPSASLGVDGRLWFASPEGLVSIFPGASARRSSNPTSIIEGVRIDGVQINGAQLLKTAPGQHDVEFDFTSPDFAAPERLHFRYKLDGFDHDWNDAGKRQQAFYTRLPPGKYTMLVQASDGDPWPADSASMKLVVAPHFWQTVWFRLMAFTLVMVLCWAAYEMRVLALRRNQRILQEQVVARTAELQEAVHEAEVAQHELQELATRDSMTRLWNRRHIFSMLSNEADRTEREHLSLCVLLLDVDHFKQVNDTCGHLAGDRVLQAVANVLIDQTRPYDCSGRYGGEEFLIILCNCSLKNGIKRANMIREAIARTTVEWNGKTLDVTASFGVALHVPGKTIEAVLDEADRALYRAKQTGRNRVCSPLPMEVQATFVSENDDGVDVLLDRSRERKAAIR